MYGDTRAFTRFALYRNRPSMLLDNLERKGQSQAGSRYLGGEKRIEDILDFFFWDSLARIGYLNLHPLIDNFGAHLQNFIGRWLHRFYRVLDNI